MIEIFREKGISTPPAMMPYIRPIRPGDDPALSRICLLTGAAGQSAEPYHAMPELLGLIFALPYNNRFSDITFGFVLVDKVHDYRDRLSNHAELQTAIEDPRAHGEKTIEGEEVVGYILGTTDSVLLREYEAADWWPGLRQRYPLSDDSASSGRTEADNRLIRVLHSPYVDPPAITDPYPAHIHIDILPSYQRKGYGRKLMSSAVDYLRSKGHGGLFVGLDPTNEPAKKFYARLGFRRIDQEGGEWWSLDFERFGCE